MSDRPAPQRLLDIGQGLAIWLVHVDDLHEQPINARSMTPQAFARLQSTIGRDSRLESLPFCALTSSDPVRIEIISGHHRTRAARAAEVFLVHCLVDETGLSGDQIKAKQLSANAIQGEDEAQLLMRIYASITDVDARLESFIQPVQDLPAPVRMPRLDIDLGYRTMQLVFLPHQAAAFEQAIGQFTQDGALAEDAELFLVDKDLDERWRAACRRMGKEHQARAVTVQVARIVAAAMAHLGADDGADPDPAEWVPLADLLGSALVPPGAAEVIRRCVDGMTRAGRVHPKRGWEAVLELASDYAEQGGQLRP